MAVLLIGSTGNGKSTLGNFLVDPSEDSIFEKQCFKTAQTNMPQTQNVSQVSFQTKRSGTTITVIDTPGLNENDVRDLKHMIQIVENLKRVKNILACILVVKFSSKIDAQYKATVQYYRKLLPSLFERNVIIVMTDYATDKRAVYLRRKQGINVEQIKRNTLREIVESGSLAYEPLLFTIDCLPLEDEERQFSLAERKAILSKVLSQRPFVSSDLKVAKTAYLKSQDQEKMKEYGGEITGYNKRLQQANKKAKEALQKIQQKEQEITEKEKELKRLKSELADKDSSELTEVGSWSVNEEWKLLQWFSRNFEKTSPCEIESVTKWTNGHCEWKDYEETKYTVKGKVEGEFMRGIYASLSLEATKRKKYESEISSLKQQTKQAEDHKGSLLHHLTEIKDRFKDYIDDIDLLEKFISERRQKIGWLASDYLTLEEAQERLKELQATLPGTV